MTDIWPVISVDISFSTPPAGPATWEDVTPWVQAWKIKTGRQTELDRIQAGTGTVTLLNLDRRFDPFNTSSPYYPGVKPAKRIRIRATWNGTTYPIFSGYIERWPQRLEGYENATVTVPFTDGFKVLSLAKVTLDVPQERSDLRVNRILDWVGWSTGQSWMLGDATLGVLGSTTFPGPVGEREVARGDTTVMADSLENVSALAHLQAVTAAENGLLVMGPMGEVRYAGRSRRIQAPYSVNQATFGDRPLTEPELPYVRVGVDADDAQLWNDIVVTRDGGTAQRAEDTASIEAYFRRTLSQTGLPLLTDDEALSAANWKLGLYKQPSPRIGEMDLDGALDIDGAASSADLWATILARRVGDRVTVVHRPVDSSAPTFDAMLLGSFGLGTAGEALETEADWAISQAVVIEGIEHAWTLNERTYDWPTTWLLSPAEDRQWWVLGDSVTGLLGTSTIPSYAIFGLIFFDLLIRHVLAFAPSAMS